MSISSQSKAYPWALTGIFAAVHLIITLIPYNIAIGGEGAISFGLISAPIVGFLLGPFFGVISVLIGSEIAMLMFPSLALIGPFTAIATAFGAFGAGALRTKWRFSVPVAYLIFMGVFIIGPIGLLLPQFLIFQVIVFLLSLVFVIPKVSKLFLEPFRRRRDFNRAFGLFSIWLLSIVAVTLDHVFGLALGVFWFNIALAVDPTTIAVWFAPALLIIPIERIVGSVIVALILAALIEVLVRNDFNLPLTRIGSYELLELSEEEI
ncbi:MAG: hypothetical protein ACFFE6_11350 [Candidatus Thorarchaeota archaeon]